MAYILQNYLSWTVEIHFPIKFKCVIYSLKWENKNYNGYKWNYKLLT